MQDIKDISQFSRSLNGHVVRTSPFGRNASGERAYRRAERLVAALHLLTNHVNQDEPVRQTIRRRGVQLLSNMLDLRDEMRGTSSAKTRAVQASLRELISLVRILTVSGLISFQNADVAIESLDELGNFLNASRRSPLSEDVVLSRDELVGGNAIFPYGKRSLAISERGVLSDISGSRASSDVKDKAGRIRRQVLEVDSVMNERAQNIINVLRSGGELGIKDICAHFPEYSEKMVQRELAFLVSDKKVRKRGLKRWSRYSLLFTENLGRQK